MEEELNYATVVFKNRAPHAKEDKEEPTIYSEVKTKASTSSVPADDKAAARSHLCVLAVCLGILCFLLVASVSAIVYICVAMNGQKANLSNLEAENQQLIKEKSILEKEMEDLSKVTDNLNLTLGVQLKEKEELSRVADDLNRTLGVQLKEKEELSRVADGLNRTLGVQLKEKEELSRVADGLNRTLGVQLKEKEELSRVADGLNRTLGVQLKEKEELSRVADGLNWTLGVILKFNTFPVNDYCPEKKCEPCLKNWILFQEKCYLFYEDNSWQTWEGSRSHCQKANADLVVIDSLQEQEFISNNTKYYYDKFHGYWLGLFRENSDKHWVWVDGRNDTLGYWMRQTPNDSDNYAMMVPEVNSTANWKAVNHNMKNRFMCESDVLIRSN